MGVTKSYFPDYNPKGKKEQKTQLIQLRQLQPTKLDRGDLLNCFSLHGSTFADCLSVRWPMEPTCGLSMTLVNISGFDTYSRAKKKGPISTHMRPALVSGA